MSFLFAESIAVQPSTATGAIAGTPDSRHVKHTGTVQMASVFGGDVTNRRTRRLHPGGQGTRGGHARPVQVSDEIDQFR